MSFLDNFSKTIRPMSLERGIPYPLIHSAWMFQKSQEEKKSKKPKESEEGKPDKENERESPEADREKDSEGEKDRKVCFVAVERLLAPSNVFKKFN